MGMWHTAYLAYGIQIPDTDPDDLNDAIYEHKAEFPDVGYLQVGPYDRDFTFLVTDCFSADLGGFQTVTPQRASAEQYDDWDRQLRVATAVLGIPGDFTPAWVLVADMS